MEGKLHLLTWSERRFGDLAGIPAGMQRRSEGAVLSVGSSEKPTSTQGAFSFNAAIEIWT